MDFSHSYPQLCWLVTRKGLMIICLWTMTHNLSNYAIVLKVFTQDHPLGDQKRIWDITMRYFESLQVYEFTSLRCVVYDKQCYYYHCNSFIFRYMTTSIILEAMTIPMNVNAISIPWTDFFLVIFETFIPYTWCILVWTICKIHNRIQTVYDHICKYDLCCKIPKSKTIKLCKIKSHFSYQNMIWLLSTHSSKY